LFSDNLNLQRWRHPYHHPPLVIDKHMPDWRERAKENWERLQKRDLEFCPGPFTPAKGEAK
jgi:hypothetical protein